jgi:hypothetical protein
MSGIAFFKANAMANILFAQICLILIFQDKRPGKENLAHRFLAILYASDPMGHNDFA